MSQSARAESGSWSPLKKTLATIAGAFALSAAFNAQAHVPADGSPQNLLLKPYEEFIVHMKNKSGGSCCNKQDGRGELEERTTKAGKLEVKITHDLAGNALPGGGKWVEVPEQAILTTKLAEEVCKPRREADPASTCKMPPFNVIWYNDSGHIYCYFPRPQIM
ncbi:MAG: hypothetical protein NDJ24_02185 [Alphaproteobacteria bacterium]|nr:hypothetical protein [Alphaproteobacteria bacterium]